MCRTQTRPKPAEHLSIAGIGIMVASTAGLAAIIEHVDLAYLAAMVASNGLVIGAMMIYGSAMVDRAEHIEDKLDTAVAEDPDTVTHIDRRRI